MLYCVLPSQCVNTHSAIVIFCFSARNDETYSARLCGDTIKTNREQNKLIGDAFCDALIKTMESYINLGQSDILAVLKVDLTWCKTVQFWQLPAVASAAIATVLDWLSPRIMVTQVSQCSKQHLMALNNTDDHVSALQNAHQVQNNQDTFASPTLAEDPRQDPAGKSRTATVRLRPQISHYVFTNV